LQCMWARKLALR